MEVIGNIDLIVTHVLKCIEPVSNHMAFFIPQKQQKVNRATLFSPLKTAIVPKGHLILDHVIVMSVTVASL